MKKNKKQKLDAPMQKFLYKLFYLCHLEGFYEHYWNPLNYMVIGAIGVLINTIVMALTLPLMFWLFADFIAILSAWTWNWSQSVGAFGYLWGFNKHEDSRN